MAVSDPLSIAASLGGGSVSIPEWSQSDAGWPAWEQVRYFEVAALSPGALPMPDAPPMTSAVFPGWSIIAALTPVRSLGSRCRSPIHTEACGLESRWPSPYCSTMRRTAPTTPGSSRVAPPLESRRSNTVRRPVPQPIVTATSRPAEWHLRRLAVATTVATVATVLACATGCGVRSNLKPGPGVVPFAESAIVVIGVKQGHGIALSHGNLDGDEWRFDFLGDLAARVFPDKDGFLVVKLPPQTGTAALAVTQVTVDDIGSPPHYYKPCTGNVTFAIQADAGKVTYVGDIVTERDPGGGGISYRLEFQEEEARVYIARRFPGLAPAFVRRDALVRRIHWLPCPSNVPTVIFVPI